MLDDFGYRADMLIQGEVERQDRMWGVTNDRADVKHGQMTRAAAAQLEALMRRQTSGLSISSEHPPAVYPEDWSGFRDYGSDIANLVVGAAYLRQEIKRKLRAGESTERLSRNPSTQPYKGDQPTAIEP
jgi:hypothetical protein